MLLATPAGRGKSALLVHWLRRVGANPNITVAYVPISIRFRTNREDVVFAILAARLAKLNNRKLPRTVGLSPEEWRGVVSGYLADAEPERKPVVLIIDS